MAVVAILTAWGLVAAVRPLLRGITIAWVLCYSFNTLYRTWLAWQSVRALKAGDAFAPYGNLPADDECPRYTILLPLYREAAVVRQLTEAVRALDYPIDRLEVLCILRPDDPETRQALEDLRLPSYFRILLLPADLPVGTKPASCNYGLANATGDLLVIFDAEDVPEPLQLRKAAGALRLAPPKIAVVQTPKAVYNGSQSIVTHVYELEALTWHHLFLPGITAREGFGPLHGSGAHFRTPILRELGGFDYYNVTEDCDLGVRLYSAGYRIQLLESVTGEEAPPTLRGWIQQRTRWNKGYIQSFFVHTRRPLGVVRRLGPRRSLAFIALLPTAIANVLVGAPAWVGAYLWVALRAAQESGTAADTAQAVIQGLWVSGTALGLLSLALFGAGAITTRRWRCLPYVLLAPVHWLMLAVAAYRALWQFMASPYGWEKTRHGDAACTQPPPSVPLAPPPLGGG